MQEDHLNPSPTSGAKAQRGGLLVSRNVTVNGRRTSVRLEPDMWDGLREICFRERQSLHELCSLVAIHKKSQASLTSALRIFILSYFHLAATEEGHLKVGHGAGGPFATRRYANVTT